MTTTLPHSGSETSRAAARDAQPKARRDRQLLCEFIAKAGAHGATDDEIADRLGHEIHFNAARARRGECWAYGYLSDSLGEVRATRSGSIAKVWHPTRKLIIKLEMPDGSWCLP